SGRLQPAEERVLVVLVVGRDPAVEVRAAQPKGLVTPVRVPGIADVVAVLVTEVVGLPGLRRQDDGDAMLTEPARMEDEGGESHPAASSGQARVVHAARPIP